MLNGSALCQVCVVRQLLFSLPNCSNQLWDTFWNRWKVVKCSRRRGVVGDLLVSVWGVFWYWCVLDVLLYALDCWCVCGVWWQVLNSDRRMHSQDNWSWYRHSFPRQETHWSGEQELCIVVGSMRDKCIAASVWPISMVCVVRVWWWGGPPCVTEPSLVCDQ
jgi:hypothetical protein